MAERTTPAPRPGDLDCAHARVLLARGAAGGALGEPPLAVSDRARLEAHVAGCAACQTRLDQLATAVLLRREEEIPCVECGAAMDEWLALEETGDAARSHLPLVAAHLETCPECRQELATLREVLAALAADALPRPTAAPRFDLRFLRGPAAEGARSAGAASPLPGEGLSTDAHASLGAQHAPGSSSPRAAPSAQAEGDRRSPWRRLGEWWAALAPTATPVDGPPPARRALGELLLPLGALAMLLLFLAAIVRPDEPATVEPGATATVADSAAGTPTPSGGAGILTPSAAASVSATATAPLGGIVPAAGPTTPTPNPGTPTTTSASPADSERQRDRDEDAEDDQAPARAASTATSRPEPGYPGPAPEARPTSPGYPGAPTAAADGGEGAAPTADPAYPGPGEPTTPPPATPAATDPPTAPPTAPPGGVGTPTADSLDAGS